MIRIRISKGVTPELLLNNGYARRENKTTGSSYYVKNIGSYELQIKLDFPNNFRLKDWDDNRTPWILMKFLLSLEEGTNIVNGKIKVIDQGKYKILDIKDTLEMIQEINSYTDICKRLTKWYQDYIDGLLRF